MNVKEVSYWDFIAEYLPNYESRDDVLLSDILSRVLNNEYVENVDLIYISEICDIKDARKLHLELDKSLMTEAMEAYFIQKFSTKKQ